MITVQDQEELFELISNYLEEDVECFALGGTAMMFYGYKITTKDIDLVFLTEKERIIFINAIEQLGYKQISAKGIYSEKTLLNQQRPLMFSRGDERFDLFLKNIFGFQIDENIIFDFFARHDFITKKELIVKVLNKEYIVLLKSVTNREKDFEDIQTIVKKDKHLDWDKIIDEAIRQKENNQWILLDLEEKMNELKKSIFLPSKLFKKLYEEQD